MLPFFMVVAAAPMFTTSFKDRPAQTIRGLFDVRLFDPDVSTLSD